MMAPLAGVFVHRHISILAVCSGTSSLEDLAGALQDLTLALGQAFLPWLRFFLRARVGFGLGLLVEVGVGWRCVDGPRRGWFVVDREAGPGPPVAVPGTQVGQPVQQTPVQLVVQEA